VQRRKRVCKNRAECAAGKKGKPAWLRFLAHFNDVLIYVLLAAAVLTAVMGHWVDTLVILGVAVINALIGHIQESNAEKSLKSIRNMLSSDARYS
jgi:magnesium-transporting ATPase (P-type)